MSGPDFIGLSAVLVLGILRLWVRNIIETERLEQVRGQALGVTFCCASRICYEFTDFRKNSI